MSKPGKIGILARMTIVLAMGILSVTPAANGFLCPNVTEVTPCSCNTNGTPGLDCVGPDVTQAVLNRVLTAVRRENNGTLELTLFTLKFTNMTEVDLTPFNGGIFWGMLFENNSLLSRVLGPDLNLTDWSPIQIVHLSWSYNNFQDEGLQTMLNYFFKPDILDLYFCGNKLRGTLGQEFLPGFSEVTGVLFLCLSDNNIRTIGGGQFQGMRRLDWIGLGNTGLEEIGEDAFSVGSPAPGDSPSFTLYLGNNNLSDESFHPSSGISSTNKSAVIILENNNFQKVREDKFLNFLETHPGNWMDFGKNPIWCDPEMKWLKDRRQEFERRVRGLNCVNDPGQTVFTSLLVDG